MFPALAESFFKGGSGPKSSSGSALSSSSGSPPSSRCGPSSSQASWNTFLADASWSSQAGARIVDPVSLQVKKDSSSPLSLTTGESSPSLSHLEPSPWHTFVWKKVMPSQVRTALLPYCFTSYERVSALRSPVPSVSSRRAGPTVHLGFGRGVEPKSRASLQFGLTTAPARTQGSTEESLLPGGSRGKSSSWVRRTATVFVGGPSNAELADRSCLRVRTRREAIDTDHVRRLSCSLSSGSGQADEDRRGTDSLGR